MVATAVPLRTAATLVVSLACAVPAVAAPPAIVAGYAAALGTAQPAMPPSRRAAVAERVTLISSYYRLDPALLMALVSVESAWHPLTQSPVGAIGLGQLMPDTAAALDVLPLRADENLDGAARYLRRMLDRFGASERLALAAYNAGPAAVTRFGGIPPYRETQTYVARVLGLRARLASAAGAPVAPRAIAVVLPVAHRRRSAPAAHRPSVAGLAYLTAPDPNGVAFSDLPAGAPAPVAVARAKVDPSTSVLRRLFGRRVAAGT